MKVTTTSNVEVQRCQQDLRLVSPREHVRAAMDHKRNGSDRTVDFFVIDGVIFEISKKGKNVRVNLKICYFLFVFPTVDVL